VLGFGTAVGSQFFVLFHWTGRALWNIRRGIPGEAAVNELVFVVFANGLRDILFVNLFKIRTESFHPAKQSRVDNHRHP